MRIAAFLGIGMVACWAAQAGAKNEMATTEPQRLVIVGASYAAGWRPQLPDYQVINKGVGGEDTHQVRARFERDVLALRPQVVVIWGHINNIHRAASGDRAAAAEKVKADYVDMITRARGAGVRVIVGTEVTLTEAVGWINRALALVNRWRGKVSYAAQINAEVRSLNDWLRRYARQHNIQVLDFERALADEDGFRKREYSASDGTHISAAGYAALTAYAQPQLRAP